MKNNIILIGMPGAGKSTVGVLLAKALGMDFVDTDLIIQLREGRRLQEMIDADGLDYFLRAEDEIIASLTAQHSVIATGGSAVFGKKAMENLKSLGRIIYLRASFETINSRLSDITTRGVAMQSGQSLESIYRERSPLYEAYADMAVDVDLQSVEQTVEAIVCAAAEN